MARVASPVLQLLLTVLGTLVMTGGEEIRVPPSIVSPVEGLQLSYTEHDRVEVKCSATGQPPPSYKWLWDGNDINSDYITFSATTGILTIPSLTTREEGSFVCYARNTFSNGMTATAVSATVEIRVARVGDFVKRSIESYSGTEGNYVTIPCDKILRKYYGAITFKWYTVLGSRNDEVFPDERKLIDQGGNLHFSYVLESDERAGSTTYKCAISSIKANVIRIGNENSLTVTSTGPIRNSAPRLEYSTSGSFLIVEIGKNATLECVFSGYVSSNIPSETVPRVTWFEQDGRAITQGSRYDITSNGRTLTIMNVTEDDEKNYRCRGTNSMGSDEGSLALNVTSRPIWVHRLESTTVVEGKDAVFSCVTRSAKGEQSPSQPKWSLNTNQMDSTYDPYKYQFNADKTTLTVKFVNKDKDIACFQCKVANSVGMVQDNGCVIVIKPIEIRVRPAAEQSVKKGDVVDLTVVATTDPLYEPNMTYSWIFKNVTYSGNKAPPRVTYDLVNNRAYINTSRLTDKKFKYIAGLYRRVVAHPVQTVYVDVTVTTEAESATDEDNTQDSNKQSDTAVIAGAAVAGAAVVGLSASSSLLFWKKRKRQRLLAEQEKHRHEEGSFRPLHDPDDEETYVEIPDVGDQPAPGDEYGYSEIQDGTDKGRGHQPPLPKRDGQRTENGENPYDQANSSSEDVRPGSSKKATKKVSMNLNGAEIPYDVCRDTEQRRSSSETSSQESPASSSPSSKGNESESYTYPGSQHGQKEDYLTPAPSSPGAQKTGSRSLAAAVVKGADYLTPTSAERQGQTQVVTAEVNRADDYLTPTSDTTVEGVKVATDDVGRADDYLTPTSNTSAEGKQAATAADYYLTPTSGETRDTAEVAPANDYLTPAPGKSEKGSTPGVPDDKQAHIYTPLLQQPKNPQFVLSEEMKKAGYLTPVHIPTTPDTQETDSTISDRKKAGYLTPVEVPGSPELGTKGQEKPAPSQDVKKPQDYLTPVSSSSSPSSSSVAAPAKKKKEKSSMIPLAEFWSSKRLSSQRKSPPSSEGETEATHTYEKMGNVKYTEPGNDPAYTKIGEVPVTVSTDPDPSSYQNC